MTWLGLQAPCAVTTVTSLAKSFGAPLAVIAGQPHHVGAAFEGATQLYSSPPTAPELMAAKAGLDINAHWGDRLRALLWDLVATFRQPLAHTGLLPRQPFPVQPLGPMAPDQAEAIRRRLAAEGVRTVVQRRHDDPESASLVVAITTMHSRGAVGRAAALIADASARLREVRP